MPFALFQIGEPLTASVQFPSDEERSVELVMSDEAFAAKNEKVRAPDLAVRTAHAIQHLLASHVL